VFRQTTRYGHLKFGIIEAADRNDNIENDIGRLYKEHRILRDYSEHIIAIKSAISEDMHVRYVQLLVCLILSLNKAETGG